MYKEFEEVMKKLNDDVLAKEVEYEEEVNNRLLELPEERHYGIVSFW